VSPEEPTVSQFIGATPWTSLAEVPSSDVAFARL
jgi:hypothetical protein